MAAKKKKKKPPSPPPLFVVSGGEGASGEQIIRTALAQFEEAQVKVVILPHVRREEQIQKAVERAAASGGTIIHTLVDAGLRRALTRQARASNVIAISNSGLPVDRAFSGSYTRSISSAFRRSNSPWSTTTAAMSTSWTWPRSF